MKLEYLAGLARTVWVEPNFFFDFLAAAPGSPLSSLLALALAVAVAVAAQGSTQRFYGVFSIKGRRCGE